MVIHSFLSNTAVCIATSWSSAEVVVGPASILIFIISIIATGVEWHEVGLWLVMNRPQSNALLSNA